MPFTMFFLHLYEREHKLWESQNMKFYLLNCLKNRIRTIKKKEMNTEFLEEGSDNYSFLIEVNGFELIDEEKRKSRYAKTAEKRCWIALQTGNGRLYIFVIPKDLAMRKSGN